MCALRLSHSGAGRTYWFDNLRVSETANYRLLLINLFIILKLVWKIKFYFSNNACKHYARAKFYGQFPLWKWFSHFWQENVLFFYFFYFFIFFCFVFIVLFRLILILFLLLFSLFLFLFFVFYSVIILFCVCVCLFVSFVLFRFAFLLPFFNCVADFRLSCWVCLFVCLFVFCLFVGVLVYLFVCLFVVVIKYWLLI